jgi:uncharacterized iron-regulated membrane protein
MSDLEPPRVWKEWVRRPQGLLFRKAVFQVHLWVGLSVGLYLCMICVTGSVLVYRNELYAAFSPAPVIVQEIGRALTPEQIERAARTAYPSDDIASVEPGDTANQAILVTFRRGDRVIRRLFDPYTGVDLGDPLAVGFRLTQWLLDLHDNLLAGETGRRVNGVGALCLLLLCATGAVIWWPGIRNWRGSVAPDGRRLTWSLHSSLGLWAFAFLVMWGLTGVYLAYPQAFATLFDYLEPFDANNLADRIGDRIQYWLGYLHFGRLGGRGIPGCGRGLCNTTTKVVWAVVALVPPVMFVTGTMMWWSRVIRPFRRRLRRSSRLTIRRFRGPGNS